MTSDQRKARHELLKKIYEPAAKYAKDTSEYNELANSGKVWENYFRPSDDGPYRLVQQVRIHVPHRYPTQDLTK